MSNVIPLGAAAKFLTTKEAANRLGVSLRTIQLWVESSILPAAKTPGGHRRIPYMAVEALAMNMGLDAVSKAWPGAQEALETTVALKPNPHGQRADALLLVDDAHSLRSCQQALTQFKDSLNLRIAEDGYAGLIHIGQRCPDILIMQLNLPGIDGSDMLNALRSKGLLTGVYVLIIGSPESLKKFDVPDDVDVLPWPVMPDALLGYIGSWLFDRQAAGDAYE